MKNEVLTMKIYKRFYIAVACLIAVITACILGACAVNFSSGATVSILIESELSPDAYVVTTSFGTLQGENGQYSVHVDYKRDFVITVNAEGYETYNLQISVDDLKSGECERTIEFYQKSRTDVNLIVNGVTDNVRAQCGTKALSFQDGLFTGAFTREELRSGITITANGAETRLITLTEEQLDSTILRLETRLVKIGYRVATVYGMSESDYAIKNDGTSLPITKIATGQNNYLGYVEIPSDYHENIRIKSYDAPFFQDKWVFQLNATHGAYDYSTVIPSDKALEISIHLTVAETKLYSENMFYEKDGILFHFPAESVQGHLLLTYQGDPSEIKALWLMSPAEMTQLPEEFDPRANCMRMEYSGQTSVTIQDFIYYSRPDETSATVFDAFYQTPYHGEIYCGDEKLTQKDGVFDWNSGDILSSVPNGRSDIIDSDNFTYTNGKWVKLLNHTQPLTYVLNLTDENGNPITGGTLTAGNTPIFDGEHAQFEETATGKYSYTAYLDGKNRLGGFGSISLGNVTHYFSLSPYDLSSWICDDRTLTATVIIKEEVPIVFEFAYSNTDTRSEYTIIDLSFSDGEENVLDQAVLSYSRRNKYYQIVAPADGKVVVNVKYARYNNLTGMLGDAVNKTFEFSVSDLLANGMLEKGAYTVYMRSE